MGRGDVGRRGRGEMNGSEGEDKKARVPAGRVAEAQGSKDGCGLQRYLEAALQPYSETTSFPLHLLLHPVQLNNQDGKCSAMLVVCALVHLQLAAPDSIAWGKCCKEEALPSLPCLQPLPRTSWEMTGELKRKSFTVTVL